LTLLFNPSIEVRTRLDINAEEHLGMLDSAVLCALSDITTVRLNVEENQLVNVFGEFCVCVGSLKSA
jgi:hypothetical protein